MAYPRSIDPRRIVRVTHVKTEAPEVKTLFFRDALCRAGKPGQYIMAWAPGVDEVPLSLSNIERRGLSSVTVKEVGPGTRALFQMVKGGIMGVRGPYGNWFNPVKGRTVIVGGGTGLSPLLPLLEWLLEEGSTVHFIAGGRTREDILFRHRTQDLLGGEGCKYIVATEDGCLGIKGTAVDAFKEVLERQKFDMAYSCGPEPMTRRVFQLSESHNLKLQVCTERIIRCSIGLCGSCAIGGYRACKEGLILSTERLREVIGEFGVFKRGLDGRRRSLEPQ